jgi:hypothetical protein
MKQAAKSGLKAFAWVWLVVEALLIGVLAGVTVGLAAGSAAGVAAGAGVLAVWCLAIKRSSFAKLLTMDVRGGQA